MADRRRRGAGDPDWVSRLRLSVPDSDTPGEDDLVRIEPRPHPERPGGAGIPVRWCALLAVSALGLAAAGGGLLDARRGRTVTSTVLAYRQPHGFGLTGCPVGDVCQPLPQSDAELADLRPPELAGASLLASSVLIDSATDATIRTVQVLTADRLTMTISSQCVPGAAAVPSRDTEPTRAADGSTELALIRPGRQPGCSVALVARVPAGRPVPTDRLRRLADELPQRLVDN